MASSREVASSENIRRINWLLQSLIFASSDSLTADHRICLSSDYVIFFQGSYDVTITLGRAIVELAELRNSSGELPEDVNVKILSTIADRALNSAKHRRFEPFRLLFDNWCQQDDAKYIPEPLALKSFVSTLRNGLLSKFGGFFHSKQKQAFIAGLDRLSEDHNTAKQQLVLLLNQNKTLLPKGESFDRLWEISVVYNVNAPREFLDFDAKKLNRILLLGRVKQIYPTILYSLDIDVPYCAIPIKKLAAAFATVPPTVKTLVLHDQNYYYPDVPKAKWLKLLNQLPASVTSITVDRHCQPKIDAALLETQRRGYKIAVEALPFSLDIVGEVMTFVADMPHFWNKRSVVPAEEKFKEKHLKKAILR
ncbi:MAG: hypothetical protein ACYCQI_11490 [Gammaproteobacteria bacterium]